LANLARPYRRGPGQYHIGGHAARHRTLAGAAQALTRGMVVMDIVYNPLETQLLRDARAAGCTVIDGLSMFVHQGARQLELWTGQAPPVRIMREAVLDALARRGSRRTGRTHRNEETALKAMIAGATHIAGNAPACRRK
jgi:hypothetical protein